MALRWFIEDKDGEGYLMPIGAQCEEMASIYEKVQGTPAFATDNPPLRLRFTGVATNQNATPTVAQVQSAIEGFQDFFLSNKKITKVRLREVSGSGSPMGGTAASAPGSSVKDYDVAFTDSGWEVMDFSVMDIVEKQNFSFKVLLANLYVNTAGQKETIDVGKTIEAADFVEERSIQGGIVRTVISAALKLRERSQATTAINMALSMAKGEVFSPAASFNDDSNDFEADTNLTVNGKAVIDSNIETISAKYNPVTLDFSCTVVAVRPTDKPDLFRWTSSIRVTGSADIDTGYVTSRLKGSQRFAGLALQRSHPKEIAMTINIHLVSFRSESDYNVASSRVDAIIADMDFGRFVYMGGGWGRSTGSVTMVGDDDVEAGNIWTRSIHLVGAETGYDLLSTATPEDLEVEALEILNHVSLNVFLGSDALNPNIGEIGELNRG